MEGDSERAMRRALAEASARHGVKNWKGLAHLLGQSPQTIWNWRHRVVPLSAFVLMSEKIGCSLEALRGKSERDEQQLEQIEDADLTPEENVLIAHYRRAEQDKREALFKIVTGLSTPPQKPHQSERVVPLRKRKHK